MNERIFECVPNVSEGRDARTIDACAIAIERAGALLADRSSDADHNRSVFTFFGSHDVVLAAATALAVVTTERIDLRTHAGAHPRMGALDVLPFIALGAAEPPDAIELARATAARIWDVCGVPSVFYGAAATDITRSSLATVRSGGFEAIRERGHRNGSPSDVGSRAVHDTAGAVAVGVRGPLVAYNVVLATNDLAIAREIGLLLRERGGGLRSLRCLAIPLGDGTVQVSCNLTEPSFVDPGLVYALVTRLAAERGVGVCGSELVGLVPRRSLAHVMAREFGIEPSALLAPPPAP